jgi:hypothetical protein
MFGSKARKIKRVEREKAAEQLVNSFKDLFLKSAKVNETLKRKPEVAPDGNKT